MVELIFIHTQLFLTTKATFMLLNANFPLPSPCASFFFFKSWLHNHQYHLLDGATQPKRGFPTVLPHCVQPNLKEAFLLCCHTVCNPIYKRLSHCVATGYGCYGMVFNLPKGRHKSKHKLWNSIFHGRYQYHKLQGLVSQTVRLIIDTFKMQYICYYHGGRTFFFF